MIQFGRWGLYSDPTWSHSNLFRVSHNEIWGESHIWWGQASLQGGLEGALYMALPQTGSPYRGPPPPQSIQGPTPPNGQDRSYHPGGQDPPQSVQGSYFPQTEQNSLFHAQIFTFSKKNIFRAWSFCWCFFLKLFRGQSFYGTIGIFVVDLVIYFSWGSKVG